MKKKYYAASALCLSALMSTMTANAGVNDGNNVDASVKEMHVNDSASVQEKINERALGEVVVTTQKRHQSTVEIPTSVSAVTGSLLSVLNLNQMDQVSALIPGIQIQQQSPNNSSYAVRGVTSDDGSATSQPRVSVFLDGVPNFRTQSSQVELFDMDRVEVTKGPQGTLFGRGAEIGAIDLIRKKPTNKLSGEFSINYGTRNQFGVSGVLNTPIISNKLLNRFAVSYDRHDGYIKNEAGGRLNGKSSLALRNSTRYYLGDNTKLDLVLDYQYDNYPGTSFKSKLFAPENGYASTEGIFDANSTANLEEGEWLGIKRHIGGGLINLSTRLSDSWTLTSLTGVRGYSSKENFDADGTYLPLLKCTEEASGIQASEEIRFNFDNRGPLKAFVGASYFYESVKQEVDLNSNLQYLYPAYIQSQLASQFSSYLNSETYQSLVDYISNYDFSSIPTYGAFLNLYKSQIVQLIASKESDMLAMANNWFSYSAGDKATNVPDIYSDLDAAIKELTGQLNMSLGLDDLLSLLGIDTSSSAGQLISQIKSLSGASLTDNYSENAGNYAQNHSVDIFADGSWTIAKGLTATLGLRGTYEHQRSGYASSTDTSLSPFGALLYYPSVNGEKVWVQKDYLSWVGRFALNYMFKRNNIYASVSRGRRPGVIAFSNNPDEVSRLKPEIIWNYEAGIKGYATRNLYYDICVYYYDWYHFQSTSLVNQEGSVAKVSKAIDAGRAHSLGFEGTLRYAPCDMFNVFATYAYNDAKFNDTDENGDAQEYAGNRFRLTPKNTFALGCNLTVPTSNTAFLYFSPTYTWKSKIYFDDDNDESLTQDAYGLLNFTLGYHFSPGKVSYDISLFGRNALDEKYIVDAGNSGRNIGFPTYVGGSRSVFGAMFKVAF